MNGCQQRKTSAIAGAGVAAAIAAVVRLQMVGLLVVSSKRRCCNDSTAFCPDFTQAEN